MTEYLVTTSKARMLHWLGWMSSKGYAVRVESCGRDVFGNVIYHVGSPTPGVLTEVALKCPAMPGVRGTDCSFGGGGI